MHQFPLSGPAELTLDARSPSRFALPPYALVFIDYYQGINCPAKAEDELTALAKRIREIATVSREATVDTHVDA